MTEEYSCQLPQESLCPFCTSDWSLQTSSWNKNQPHPFHFGGQEGITAWTQATPCQSASKQETSPTSSSWHVHMHKGLGVLWGTFPAESIAVWCLFLLFCFYVFPLFRHCKAGDKLCLWLFNAAACHLQELGFIFTITPEDRPFAHHVHVNVCAGGSNA